MAVRQALQPNGEFDVTTPNDVLNLKFRKLRVKPQLLNDPGVLPRRQARVILRFCPRHHHLTRRKDECSSLGVANPHYDGCKTL